jgi:hypothetical protein
MFPEENVSGDGLDVAIDFDRRCAFRRVFHLLIALIVLSMIAGCGSEILISTRFLSIVELLNSPQR